MISWLLYFLKSNRLAVTHAHAYVDPILQSIQRNTCTILSGEAKFRLFRGVRSARQSGKLLKHLDVFKPQ